MLVQINITLKEGYKPVMADQEEKEIEFYVDARNMATAGRMIRALIKNDNVESYDCVCVSDCNYADTDSAVKDALQGECTRADEIIHCNDCLMHGVCRFEIGLGINGYCSQGKRRTDL